MACNSAQDKHKPRCLVPRCLSLDENVRAKEGGKDTTGFACRLYPSHGPLRFITSHSFRARLCYAKNEAPEEEAEPRAYMQQLNFLMNNALSSLSYFAKTA